MPLHRDIYWVGRQWAVTGSGMQAIDKRLNGVFDIEIARLWEDALIESMRALEWINSADFEKGLAAARTRYPEPPRKIVVAEQIAPPEPIACPEKIAPSEKTVPPRQDAAPIEPPNPAAQSFEIRSKGLPARLLSPWRIRRQR
jgi:hypothetical protein